MLACWESILVDAREAFGRGSSPWRNRSSLAALALLLLASAAPLRAQTDLQRVLSAYPPAEAARLEAVILQPRWDGFPTELLVEHTAEGMAKGVSPDRLLSSLEEYARRLGRAHEILGKRATATSLKATAEVLARDAPDDVVRTIAAVNPRDDQLTAAMVALGDLLEAGVPASEAENLLLDAAYQRQNNDDVLQIPARVRRWIRQGYQPTDAAAEVKRTMEPPLQPGGGLIDRYTKPPPDRPYD